MKKLTRLLSLVLALGLIFVSLPRENASAAGLCVNPGGTAGCYATIGAAVNAAAAGDTITVASGTYTENVLINKSLTLSGSGAVIDGNGAGVVVVITANNVTLEGFTIQHSGSDAQTHAGVGLLWAQGCTVRNNTIAHNIHGIALMSAIHNLISNNTISANTVYGLVLEAYASTPNVASTGNTITGNIISGNGRDGIYAGKDQNNNQYLDNTITGTNGLEVSGDFEGNGIYLWKSSGNTVSGNFIADNVEFGIEMMGSSGNTITGNSITGNQDGMVIRNINESTGYSIRDNTIQGNRIFANTEVNLYADPNFEFNIARNWWGSAEESEIVAKLASWVSDDDPDPWIVPGTTVNLVYAPWCASEACSAFVYAVTPAQDIAALLAEAPAGSVLLLSAGTYSRSGAFTINTPNLTILLKSGAVIRNSSPCFAINANNTRILAEPGAKCIPTGGSNGIDVAAGITGVTMDGLEIDGSGQTTGDGIRFAGVVTDVVLVDNFIHALGGDGIEFVGAPAGVMDIHGNLFMNNTGFGINSNGAAVPAEYNSWGSASGAAAADGGDGISNGVIAVPYTHVALSLVSSGAPWANQVVKGSTISYAVKANLVNVNAADFVLTYNPALLSVADVTPGAAFVGLPLDDDPVTNAPLVSQTSGALHFRGFKLGGTVSGNDVTLFTVKFNANASGTSALNFDEATDEFGMPGVGSTENVYAAALTDGSVKVIDLPTLSSTDIQGYYLTGETRSFQVTVANPATGGSFSNVLFNYTLSGAELTDIASFEYYDGATWHAMPLAVSGNDLVGYYGPSTGFPMAPGYTATSLFRINFTQPGSYPFMLTLGDLTAEQELARLESTALVYSAPVITSADLAGSYKVGVESVIHLTITNPSPIPEPFTLLFTLPADTVITYGGNTYSCLASGCPPIPVTLPNASNELPFGITFSASFSGEISATLYDSNWLPEPRALASLTVSAAAYEYFTVTGSVTVDHTSAFNAYYTGVPVRLTKVGTPAAGPYNATTSAPGGTNLQFNNVMAGTYVITTHMPRVLNLDTAMNRTIDISANRAISALNLIRGNAVWTDNIINLFDATKIGNQYRQSGYLDGDVNFDGNVTIGDLSLVGWNYYKDSSTEYASWTP